MGRISFGEGEIKDYNISSLNWYGKTSISDNGGLYYTIEVNSEDLIQIRLGTIYTKKPTVHGSATVDLSNLETEIEQNLNKVNGSISIHRSKTPYRLIIDVQEIMKDFRNNNQNDAILKHYKAMLAMRLLKFPQVYLENDVVKYNLSVCIDWNAFVYLDSYHDKEWPITMKFSDGETEDVMIDNPFDIGYFKNHTFDTPNLQDYLWMSIQKYSKMYNNDAVNIPFEFELFGMGDVLVAPNISTKYNYSAIYFELDMAKEKQEILNNIDDGVALRVQMDNISK